MPINRILILNNGSLTRRRLGIQNNYINSTRKRFISNTNEIFFRPNKVFSNEIIYSKYKRKNQKISIHINNRI